MTEKLLIQHYKTYPKLQIQDIFKFLYQSTFGCEHFITSAEAVTTYIQKEYDAVCPTGTPLVEELDGAYYRVPLSYLKHGMRAETEKTTEKDIMVTCQGNRTKFEIRLTADNIKVAFGGCSNDRSYQELPTGHHAVFQRGLRTSYSPDMGYHNPEPGTKMAADTARVMFCPAADL